MFGFCTSSVSFSGCLIAAITVQPFEANNLAVAFPKPDEAPVMKISFPFWKLYVVINAGQKDEPVYLLVKNCLSEFFSYSTQPLLYKLHMIIENAEDYKCYPYSGKTLPYVPSSFWCDER